MKYDFRLLVIFAQKIDNKVCLWLLLYVLLKQNIAGFSEIITPGYNLML